VRDEPRREGEARGRAEGRAEERSAVLTKLLVLKFGPLEPAQQARIAAATPEQLDRWLEQVLTAGSIDAVLHA
jgi:hypothetical protein